ncbi:MAG: hypothetical protein E7207_02935 [Clostridium butyricum]|nr:hypothetical protein [Clostridium butyricum]
MKDSNLKIAQQDVEEALKAVEDMENFIAKNETAKEQLREKFICLTDKVKKLEDILKSEGIL